MSQSEKTSLRLQRFTSLCPPSSDQSALLAEGLSLAGSPLEAPRFHETGWMDLQVFRSYQDPDRCKEPWEVPTFLCRKNPETQRAKTVAEDLPLPKRVTAFGSFARVVRGVIDEEACAELISHVNAKGYTPALLNIGGGKQRFAPLVRDGFRALVDSPELANWLLEVLRPHVPEEWEGEPLIDLNSHCRFLCYTPGQQFQAHYDGCFERPSGGCSYVTLQVYLHDVPAESGGATTFLFDRKDENVCCQPGAGSVLLFSQDLYHEGSQLLSGLKYTMRTEAMYGK